MTYYVPEVPSERLKKRLSFLLDRASAHDENATENYTARACAATLRRDAACIALMLEEPILARELLSAAGYGLLELGLPTGASFLALSNVRGARNVLEPFEDVIMAARQQWAPIEAREHRKYQRPMADKARGAPYQLLAIMQSDLLTSELHPSELMDDEPIRKALSRNGGHPAGITGLSIDNYMYTANWFVHNASHSSVMPGIIRNNISTLVSARAENLYSARRDTYHWRLIARPAELLDIDATILFFLALGGGMNYSQLSDMVDQDSPMADAPLLAAKALRISQDLPN